MRQRLKRFGPGLLVAAAFVGPGTVTTASVAGADTGYALLWTLVFSIFATVVLQEMSARLGIVGRQDLGQALATSFAHPILKTLAIGSVIAAIALGAAAFQTGNIAGAALGLETLGGPGRRFWSLAVGVIAFALLATGAYRLIERVLIALVLAMSAVFLATAIIVRPDPGRLLAGLLAPSIPSGSVLTVIALVGTTVVTYNFFLHSATVQDKWPEHGDAAEALRASRWDTLFSIMLGGAVTLAIVVTAAASFYGTHTSIADAGQMARQLRPLLGAGAQWFFALGLFAAGMTSSVTAPLAAAYATSGALGWPRDLRSRKFQAVWAGVLVVGTAFACLGDKPVKAILVAQAANGVLLPLLALFLLLVMNRSALLGRYVNGLMGNILGTIVFLVAGFLGAYSVLSAFGVVGG